ncbi:DUF4190 domain-containing protein [Lentibacillus saliphilus]|uniref:DUF4190 domain-containing protein n=1 Tax=Lentibacillus saliphilus TaxID=2737028 RepID=UPI001C2F2A64|nr:DUF4190 domain-containing protein [Lentibacillus saliphilus]
MSHSDVSKGSMTNSKATTSLILGILSIVLILLPFVGLILGVAGLILGIMGLNEINRSQEGSKKVAVSGIVCSSLGILLPIILSIIISMAFTNMLAL